jgi:hypothetical protein
MANMVSEQSLHQYLTSLDQSANILKCSNILECSRNLDINSGNLKPNYSSNINNDLKPLSRLINEKLYNKSLEEKRQF